jgi:predicted nucleic acid-binding protein
MQKTIISDTSCLILLDKIGEINILHKLFGEIIITSIIADEYGKHLPDWIKIVNVENKNYQDILMLSIDKGEASAIALAVEQGDCLLILDDMKARRLAMELGLKFTGTIGLLVEAKIAGHFKSIKPILHKIRQTNFRLTRELEKKILDKAKE